MFDKLDTIVGQVTAKKFIRTALNKRALYNFLLIGPRGVGKRSFGFVLAETLGCRPESPYFMLVAPIPSKIKDKEERIYEYAKQYMPDNRVVDVEDRAAILIEQMRIVIQRLMHMPEKGVTRVVLILEADRMTDEAANCFLKTLEEPPLDTFFILTSSRPNSLLPTIRSRCQTIHLSYLTPAQVKEVICEGSDDFHVGSPGEIMSLERHSALQDIYDLFERFPIDVQTAAATAKEYERGKIVDLFYPLLLLYRLALYKKLNIEISSNLGSLIARKTHLPTEELIRAIALLHSNIAMLEQNPNHLLLLFSTVMQLP